MFSTEKETWQAYLPYFQAAQQKLEQSDWFSSQEWLYVTWENTRFAMISGQLYRAGWYNHKRNGIHFDSWLGQKELEQQVFPVALHAHGDSPLGKRVIPLLAERIAPMVTTWPNTSVNATSPFQPFIIKTTFTKDTLVSQMVRLYTQVAQLGAVVDQTIAEMLVHK